jgi:hypothetical protein
MTVVAIFKGVLTVRNPVNFTKFASLEVYLECYLVGCLYSLDFLIL